MLPAFLHREITAVGQRLRSFKVETFGGPQLAQFLRLGLVLPGLAQVGLDALDAAMPHVRALLVLRVLLRRCGPALPVFARVPQLHRLSDAVTDALRILARPALAVVPDEDRLAKGDAIRNALDLGAHRVGLLAAALAVAVEAVGPVLGALHERAVFVVHLAAPFQHQVFAGRRPHRGHEKLLAGCPRKPRVLGALIILLGQSRERVEPKFVVFRAVGGRPEVIRRLRLGVRLGCIDRALFR